jgi:hypothetical protein
MEKPECKKEYENNNLLLTKEKCDDCPYKYNCIYMIMSYADVMDDGY